MVEFCRAHGIELLCYGTVLGGFMSERWLHKPEPRGTIQNRSLVKYKLIIDDFGGWDLFQELLQVLATAATRHGTDIATVASRAMLDRPQVAAVIVGAVNTAHLQAHEQIGPSSWMPRIWGRLRRSPITGGGRVMMCISWNATGRGRHGQIMKYQLSGTAT